MTVTFCLQRHCTRTIVYVQLVYAHVSGIPHETFKLILQLCSKRSHVTLQNGGEVTQSVGRT